MPHVRRKKHRPSITKRASIVAGVCALLAVALAFSGLYLKQQEVLRENAAEAEQFTPVAIPEQSPVESRAPQVVAFVGDSYSAGAGASSGANTWTYLLSQKMGWKEVNLARGGTGYVATAGMEACGLEFCPSYAEMIPEVASAKPTVIIVSGGRNDVPQDPEQVAEAIRAFYADLRSALPDAQIIATSPLWDDDEVPADILRIQQEVSAAAAANEVMFLDVGQPLAGDPGLVTSDSVHPNDRGHAAISAAVESKLSAEL